MAGKTLTGWRYAAFVGALVGAVGITIYPTIIRPMWDPEPYKRIQKMTRKDIIQEEIQPGNMKVWTDPFGRKKSSEGSTSSTPEGAKS